jgi:hypothetical protein
MEHLKNGPLGKRIFDKSDRKFVKVIEDSITWKVDHHGDYIIIKDCS